MGHAVINAGRTDKLGNNNALRTVDDEGAAVSHEREVAHIDLALLDLACLLVVKSCGNAHRRGICCVAFLAFPDGIFSLFLHSVVNEAEAEVSAEIGDILNVSENLLKTGFKEPSVRILLNLNEVRHLHNFLNFTKALSSVGSEFYIGNIDHSLITPRF